MQHAARKTALYVMQSVHI